MRFTVDAISGLAFGADVNTLESDDDIIQRHLDKIFPAMFRRLFAPFPTWRWYRTRADRELDASVLKVNAAIDGFVAAARAAPRRRPGAPRRPGQPARGDDRRRRRPGLGHHRRRGLGQRHDDAARRRGHHRQHPGVGDLAALHPSRGAGPGARRDRRRRRRSGDLDATSASPRCAGSRPAPTRRCGSSRSRRRSPCRRCATPPSPTSASPAGRSSSWRCAAIRCARPTSPAPPSFDPQRWLDPDSGPGATSASRVSMPFGAGPRVCPGRHLAMLEMKMALATLIGRFEIERVGTPGGGEPDERMSFAMGPSGLAMRLRPRRRVGASRAPPAPARNRRSGPRPLRGRPRSAPACPSRARACAHRREVVGHRQAHRPGPGVADA